MLKNLVDGDKVMLKQGTTIFSPVNSLKIKM